MLKTHLPYFSIRTLGPRGTESVLANFARSTRASTEVSTTCTRIFVRYLGEWTSSCVGTAYKYGKCASRWGLYRSLPADEVFTLPPYSTWIPHNSRWIPYIPYGICFGCDPTQFGDSIPLIFHLDSMWNGHIPLIFHHSIWNIQMESSWSSGGI